MVQNVFKVRSCLDGETLQFAPTASMRCAIQREPSGIASVQTRNQIARHAAAVNRQCMHDPRFRLVEIYFPEGKR
jgi:hypothetical protein